MSVDTCVILVPSETLFLLTEDIVLCVDTRAFLHPTPPHPTFPFRQATRDETSSAPCRAWPPHPRRRQPAEKSQNSPALSALEIGTRFSCTCSTGNAPKWVSCRRVLNVLFAVLICFLSVVITATLKLSQHTRTLHAHTPSLFFASSGGGRLRIWTCANLFVGIYFFPILDAFSNGVSSVIIILGSF